MIDVAPINVTVASTEVYAGFNCSAVSDDSTPVKIRWERFDSKDGSFSQVYEIPGRVVVGSNGTLSFHVADNTSSWTTYEGRYKCVASNGYSNQSVEAFLHVEGEIVVPRELIPRIIYFLHIDNYQLLSLDETQLSGLYMYMRACHW